jgi:hypothetical protein
MKSKKEIKTSKSQGKKTDLQKTKVLKNLDENIYVCKQDDKDCWHRYSAAMGDCV